VIDYTKTWWTANTTNKEEQKMSKDLDESVDKLEAAVDPNTVISVGGYNFTPAKLMIAGAIVSSTLGALYGAFEVYKDYQSMKEAIQTYVTPDLSEINQKIAVLEQNSEKSTEYVRDINQTLREDIRRLESIIDSVERGQKQSQRDVDQTVKDIRLNVDQTVKDIRQSVDATVRSVTQQTNQLERETAQEIRTVRREVDDKIKKALDNPLAN
jgi:DNA anti-recombination protein RmuC